MYKYSNQKHVNDSIFFLIEEKVRFIIFFFSLQILFSTRLPVVKQIFMRIDLCAKDNVKTLITFDRGSFIQSGTYFIGFSLFDARLECEITTDRPRRLLACYSATRVSQPAPSNAWFTRYLPLWPYPNSPLAAFKSYNSTFQW